MSTNYPTALDSFPDPAASTPRNSGGALAHHTQHDNVNDATVALENYVGVTNSAVAGTVTKKLNDVIAAQASDASNISTNTTDISGLKAANPFATSHGVVFIPAGATTGSQINAAITAFAGAGGEIQLGKGTHTLDQAVLLKDNVTIRGVGPISTILVFDASSFSPAMSAGTTPIVRVQLEDFRVQNTAGSSGTGVAIDLGYVNYALVNHVDIGTTNAAPNKGFDFSINNNTSRPYYNKIQNTIISIAGTTPIGIDCSNQANSNTFENVRIGINGALTGVPIGIKVGGGTTSTHTILINHLDVEGASTMTGVLVTNSSYNVTLLDCYFEAIGTCVQIDAGCANIHGIGCYFYNSTTNNILDNSGLDISFDGTYSLPGTGASSAFALNYRAGIPPVIFTTSGSLTRAQTYGAKAIKISGCNGGAGSGGIPAAATNSAASGGGAGGASAWRTIPTLGLTFPLQVTVGTGGPGGTTAPTAGTKGVQSIVKDNAGAGATIWTPGVQNNNQAGAAGATAATVQGIATGGFDGTTTGGVGDYITPGSAGGNSFRIAATVSLAGQGGASAFSGSAANSSNGGTGIAGQLYGGGAAGNGNTGAGGATAGLAGAAGIVIVELIY